MSNDIPECFCDMEGSSTCDWVVEVTARYYRKDDPNAVKSSVPWTLENIPQLLAQVILQMMVKACNEQGAEIYLEWLKQCYGDNSDLVKLAEDQLKLD